MAEYTVVVNDCAAPADLGLIHIRLRDTEFGPKNFTYSYDRVAEGLDTPLSPAQMDWLTILAAIFAADLSCKRSAEADWNRRITLHIPVREPDAWQSLSRDLGDVFAELTFDDLQLVFHRDDSPAPPPRQRRRPFGDFDSVALFSGGMDSFVGAAVLLHEGRKPALLTHTAAGAVTTAVARLKPALKPLGPLGPQVGFTANLMGGGPAENSQRSRSLMFMGVAALLAAAADVEDVYINENGVMAIHAPMTPARVGSLSTRTAAPSLLEAVESVASRALGHRIRVRNLLQPLTKPDVVGRATELGVHTSLANTVSCWSIGRSRKHCGYCAPCLIRRISMELHGTQDAFYEHNPFAGDRRDDPTAHDNLVQLLMLAQDLQELSDLEVQLEYPEILNSGTTMSVEESIVMHRRWGEQALTLARAYEYASSLL